MTICTECKHLRIGPYHIIPKWYDYFCLHPDVQRPKCIDPVSGKECYSGQNDLGRFYPTDEPSPNCRDINNGNCPHFEEAGR